jgi:hypothetical protein
VSKKSIELAMVRHRDLRQPAWVGSREDLPAEHGDREDPRYPSPKSWRIVVSFILDLLIHLSLAYAAGLAYVHEKPDSSQLLVTALAFVLLSIVDRVFLQWALQATVGKLLTGLRLIRKDTGGRGTLWVYIRDWLFGVVAIFGVLS